MLIYLGKRLVGVIPTLIGVLTLVFLAVRLVPGDPAQAILGEYATERNLEVMRQALGLDQPAGKQYLRYISGVLQGDFGRSIQTGETVVSRINNALPFTVELAVCAIVVALLIGIPTGIIAARFRNTSGDYFASFVALLGISMPNFWLGMLLLIAFSINLGWLPITGAGSSTDPLVRLKYLLLPAITLGASEAGVVMRMTRSSVLETMSLDFVRTARAKGLREATTILKHVFRNSLIPVVTIVGLNMGRLLGGTVIIESLFVRPGVGQIIVAAMKARDYPQVQGTVAFFAICVVLVNLLVDMCYAVLDPRIRYS